jgi:hypothetical protein
MKKACLAVNVVGQIQANEIYDRLGDGTNPTGNVNLWEQKSLVGYRGSDVIGRERGGRRKRSKEVFHPLQPSIAKDGGRKSNRTQS